MLFSFVWAGLRAFLSRTIMKACQGIKLDSDMETIPVELLSQLDELGDSVINVLTVAMSHGEVHIVTNGETGWVQLSAQVLPSNTFCLTYFSEIFAGGGSALGETSCGLSAVYF